MSPDHATTEVVHNMSSMLRVHTYVNIYFVWCGQSKDRLQPAQIGHLPHNRNGLDTHVFHPEPRDQISYMYDGWRMCVLLTCVRICISGRMTLCVVDWFIYLTASAFSAVIRVLIEFILTLPCFLFNRFVSNQSRSHDHKSQKQKQKNKVEKQKVIGCRFLIFFLPISFNCFIPIILLLYGVLKRRCTSEH